MPNLLASFNCNGESHLIVGVSNAASLRITSILEAGAHPILFTDNSHTDSYPASIRTKIEEGVLQAVHVPGPMEIGDISTALRTRGRDEVDHIIDKVFVSLPIAQQKLKEQIYDECRRMRIPINTSDSPDLCTFTLLSTYTSGDFQMGVSTSGKGCKLASKIKRELTNALPSNIGEICNKIGELRAVIQAEDQAELSKIHTDTIGEHDDDAINTSTLNALVKEFGMTQEQRKTQRTRWLSQIVEYFPLSKLADLSIEDLTHAYHEHKHEAPASVSGAAKGQISLVGSGPGSVSLLTLGALQAIHSADLVLADKLVPQQVLDLIPKNRTRLFIARKFPGNAEKAQEELLSLGLEAVTKGEKVVRLKQGDPYIFGRGGEEYRFFQQHGFTPVVLPGITSALAAPVLANIPATHREVADQVLICTGTGRRGVLPNLPEFVRSRTTVFLMALHRVADLIPELIAQKGWDPKLPAAIIERGSCPDQRVIRTTLGKVAAAVEACGSRPPGLLVTGLACEVLTSTDKEWEIEEGYDSGRNLELFIEMGVEAGKVDIGARPVAVA
ncbi:methionine metabolism [Suhomyces tanzawaensis NRRL Y-17324]|uniref:Methionine metabolism n=1 Tax=Suhomyces tanzawaensis NRRL Y-17324 TaxID=984487 RepID=A0A1E4SJS1_9ASCO|nr:methionine metabolism [Suhomyces tanzawaensis NRRL Y-17324]ODV79740.1 methionine metabolism [Suhomyces tanzawaensis NRRL Y-17324]